MSLWIIFGINTGAMFLVTLFRGNQSNKWDRFVDKVISTGSVLLLSYWFPLYWHWLQSLFAQ